MACSSSNNLRHVLNSSIKHTRPQKTLRPRYLYEPSRPLSTTAIHHQDQPAKTNQKSEPALTWNATHNPPDSRPRWSYTPPKTRAPFSLRKPRPENVYMVNEDPELLDRIVERILGPGNGDLLSNEVKWLAMTHKTFDQGRRGYNERLAFLGKRIVDLQTSLALLQQHSNARYPPDEYEREQFRHPATDLLARLAPGHKMVATDVKRIAEIGDRQGIMQVIRWKPHDAKDLPGSGGVTVMAQAMYALIGALALHRGGEVATKIARERIIAQLGITI